MLDQRTDAQAATPATPQEKPRTRGLTVRNRLFIVFVVMALFMTLMAGVGFLISNTIAEGFRQATGNTLVELAALDDIQVLSSRLRAETVEYALFGEESTLRGWQETGAELEVVGEADEPIVGALEPIALDPRPALIGVGQDREVTRLVELE